jgi:hypothetical protein
MNKRDRMIQRIEAEPDQDVRRMMLCQFASENCLRPVKDEIEE